MILGLRLRGFRLKQSALQGSVCEKQRLLGLTYPAIIYSAAAVFWTTIPRITVLPCGCFSSRSALSTVSNAGFPRTSPVKSRWYRLFVFHPQCLYHSGSQIKLCQDAHKGKKQQRYSSPVHCAVTVRYQIDPARCRTPSTSDWIRFHWFLVTQDEETQSISHDFCSVPGLFHDGRLLLQRHEARWERSRAGFSSSSSSPCSYCWFMDFSFTANEVRFEPFRQHTYIIIISFFPFTHWFSTKDVNIKSLVSKIQIYVWFCLFLEHVENVIWTCSLKHLLT